jgi:hypothetical protein
MIPCSMCESVLLTQEVFDAEMGMCLDCSNAYFSHNHDDCSWGCMVEFPERMKRVARNG